MSAENEFPETLVDAVKYFAVEQNAIDFLASMRWPKGEAICPDCGHKKTSYLANQKKWKCTKCHRQFSIKVGTIMEDSPIKLEKWMVGMWLIVSSKNGISSYELHRTLGITQKSAWFMGHRIRMALQNGSFEKMKGTVEADETFIGGKARNMHKDKRREKNVGTGGVGKTAVMGLLERNVRKQCSRVKLKVLSSTRRKELHGNVKENVLEGSALHTDALRSYNGLGGEYAHQVVDHAVCYAKGHFTRMALRTSGVCSSAQSRAPTPTLNPSTCSVIWMNRPTHAAKQLPNGKWKSKLGPWEDIHHNSTKAVEEYIYGKAEVFMKRRIQNETQSQISTDTACL